MSEIDCYHCYDTGVVHIELHQNQVEMLMLCNCKQGADETYKLPRWELRVDGIASRKEFPAAWFRPPEGMRGVFGQKMEQWKAKIKVAEEYWHHQRVSK